MRIYILLFFFIFLSACGKKEPINFELISYTWKINSGRGDSLIQPFIKCRFYAHINEDGNCFLVRSEKLNCNKYKNFQIRKETFRTILDDIKKLKTDTVLVEKSMGYIYDGPMIKIIAPNKDGKLIWVGFIASNHSPANFVEFYRYIDSIDLESSKKTEIDTLKLFNERELLIKKIYNKEKNKLPIINKDEEVLEEK
jgi:hypothetical protein